MGEWGICQQGVGIGTSTIMVNDTAVSKRGGLIEFGYAKVDQVQQLMSLVQKLVAIWNSPSKMVQACGVRHFWDASAKDLLPELRSSPVFTWRIMTPYVLWIAFPPGIGTCAKRGKWHVNFRGGFSKVCQSCRFGKKVGALHVHQPTGGTKKMILTQSWI